MFAEVVAEIEALTSDDALAALRVEVLVQRRPRAGWEFFGRYEDEDAARRAVLRLARGADDATLPAL